MSATNEQKPGSRRREATKILVCTVAIFLIFLWAGKHESGEGANGGVLGSAQAFIKTLINDLNAINPLALTEAFKTRLKRCNFGWDLQCRDLCPVRPAPAESEPRLNSLGRFNKNPNTLLRNPDAFTSPFNSRLGGMFPPVTCERLLWDTFDRSMETLRGIPSAAKFTVEEVFTKGWASVVVFGFATLLVGAIAAGAIAEREFGRLIVMAALYGSAIPSLIALIVQMFLSLTLHIFSGFISLLALAFAFAVPTVLIIEKLASAHHVAEFLFGKKES